MATQKSKWSAVNLVAFIRFSFKDLITGMQLGVSYVCDFLNITHKNSLVKVKILLKTNIFFFLIFEDRII